MLCKAAKAVSGSKASTAIRYARTTCTQYRAACEAQTRVPTQPICKFRMLRLTETLLDIPATQCTNTLPWAASAVLINCNALSK